MNKYKYDQNTVHNISPQFPNMVHHYHKEKSLQEGLDFSFSNYYIKKHLPSINKTVLFNNNIIYISSWTLIFLFQSERTRP